MIIIPITIFISITIKIIYLLLWYFLIFDAVIVIIIVITIIIIIIAVIIIIMIIIVIVIIIIVVVVVLASAYNRHQRACGQRHQRGLRQTGEVYEVERQIYFKTSLSSG